MHSSRPKSCGEKLLIDMDRIRKSFANFTGGEEGGVRRAAKDEKNKTRQRGRDKQRQTEIYR